MNSKFWFTTIAMSVAASLAAAGPIDVPPVDAHGSDTPQAVSHSDLRSANAMIGASITNLDEESIGSVVDIVLDYDQSRIAYLIVSYGGFLGIGDKNFAVPWQAFESTKGDSLVLDVDKAMLEKAPGFEPGELPDQADPMFHESIYTFYGLKPYVLNKGEKAGKDRPEAKESTEADADSSESDDDSYDWASWALRDDNGDWARQLNELIGTTIENPDKTNIAELEDVIIDTREARAVYAIVSYGGVLGYLGDTAAVPWAALHLDKKRNAYTLDATPEDLDTVKFSASEYEALEDEDFGRALHKSFGSEPYWVAYGYEKAADEPATSPGVEGGAGADAADHTVLYGTVLSVGTYQAMADADTAMQNVRLRMRTTTGDERIIHLGSRAELQSQDCNLSNGDHIVVTGTESDYRGHKVIVAKQIQKAGKTIDVNATPSPAVGDTK